MPRVAEQNGTQAERLSVDTSKEDLTPLPLQFKKNQSKECKRLLLAVKPRPQKSGTPDHCPLLRIMTRLLGPV